MIASLKARFPNEAKGIEDYYKEVKKASLNTGILFFLFGLKILNNSRFFLSNIKRFMDDTIAKFTKDRKLTQFGDYGVASNKAPFYRHAIITEYYLNGAHFPKGESQEMARDLIGTVYSHGGKFLVSKRVAKILLDKSKNETIEIEMEMKTGM